MWLLLILSLCFMSIFTIFQIPKSWYKNKFLNILIILFNIFGFLSTICILFFVHIIKDSFFKEVIIWFYTIYFTILVFSFVISLFRYLLILCCKITRLNNFLKILYNKNLFFGLILIISLLYFIPAIFNATNIKITNYDIYSNKKYNKNVLTLCYIADFHVGAGARKIDLDKMLKYINTISPDAVLIGGDVADSSSSIEDLEYMENILKKINSTFGIFYAEGNHERECYFDAEKYLKNSNVKILKDESTYITNNIKITGLLDKKHSDIKDIIDKNINTKDDYNILLKHRPHGLKKFSSYYDLTLSGHTHGLQFPFLLLTYKFTRDFNYGIKKFDKMYSIVTSGVSEWGYRVKWPSRSEVVKINIHFSQ